MPLGTAPFSCIRIYPLVCASRHERDSEKAHFFWKCAFPHISVEMHTQHASVRIAFLCKRCGEEALSPACHLTESRSRFGEDSLTHVSPFGTVQGPTHPGKLSVGSHSKVRCFSPQRGSRVPYWYPRCTVRGLHWGATFNRVPSSSDNAEPVKLIGTASETLIEKCRESPGLRVTLWA